MMSKSTQKRSNVQSTSNDKNKPKSIQKSMKPLTITREIVIHTEEPDIPQITILKVQKLDSGIQTALLRLERTFDRIKMKRMYHALSQISKKNRSLKIHTIYVSRLINVLKNRQKRMIGQSWSKLMNMKNRQKIQLHTSRLISKISMLLLYKVKSNAFDRLKAHLLSKIRRSTTQASQSNTKKVQQMVQSKISQLKAQQFSEKFVALCKRFLKLNDKNFQLNLQSELEPAVIKQIQKFEQLRKGQPSPFNNEIVLIVLNNNLLTIRALKNKVQQNFLTSKESEKQDTQKKDLQSRLRVFQNLQKQFEKADNQIRESFEKHKNIDQIELSKIVEGQLKQWNKSKKIPLYNSRLFISAIIVKIIKDGQKPLNQFIQTLEQFIDCSEDAKRLQEFRRSLNKNEKASALLIEIINRYMSKNPISMAPIIQREFSENEEAIMSELKYIKQQIKDLISKFNSPSDRARLKKLFSNKRPKAPEQLKQLYLLINQMIMLIQNLPNQPNTDPKKSQMAMKILNVYKECLREGSYKKWQNFLNSQVNKQQNKALLQLLDNINDILNEKINEEINKTKTVGDLENLKKNETKMKQQINSLKSKNAELQKKLKNLQTQRNKSPRPKNEGQQSLQNRKVIQLQTKYNEVLQKYKKIQSERQKQKKVLQKAIQQLKKKLENKDQQLEKLQKQNKGLREKSSSKQKNDEELKKLNTQVQKKFKDLQKVIQKLKQQIEQKDKSIGQNQQKLKKQQATIKQHEVEIRNYKNDKSKNVDNQSNTLMKANQELNIRINQMKNKMEKIIFDLETKQNQIQNIRNSLIKQQTKHVGMQKSKTQYDAMLRKINVLDNTVENLKNELDIKRKQLDEERNRKQSEDQRKQKSSGVKSQRKTESSLELIKQLNRELENLKRNEKSLEQINKQLQKMHNKGQDVQNMISNLEAQNREYKRTLSEKENIIVNLEIYITKLQSESRKNVETLEAELINRDQKITRLQISLKERETLMDKNQQNKKGYIRRLQDLIRENESTIEGLNSEILSLKNRQLEQPSIITNQTDNFDNLITELNLANQRISQLQLIILQSQKNSGMQAQNLKNQLALLLIQNQKWDNEREWWKSQSKNWEKQRLKLMMQINTLQSQIAKSNMNQPNLEVQKEKWVSSIRNSWEIERQKWIVDFKSLEGQRQRLVNEIRNYEEERARFTKEANKWSLQREKLINQNKMLWAQNQQLSSAKPSNFQSERQKIVLEASINLQNQRKKWLVESISQRQKILRESQNLENERQRWIAERNNWQVERERLLKIVNDYELQLRGTRQRQNHYTEQINLLNITIEKLHYESTITTSSGVNIDNIILLLSNLTANFIRITPKSTNTENNKTIDQIYKDLFAIKDKYYTNQQELFINLEEYVLRFIENDIGKYRYELRLKIDELSNLKERLNEFLNRQTQISKNHLNYQYKYEKAERSTAEKTMYQTPVKVLQQKSIITRQIGEIKEKTLNAQKLFGSDYTRKY